MTNGWKEYTLGDIIRLKRGYDLPQQNRIEGKVPIFSSAGLSGYHNEAKVEGPGVITGRYGTLGEIYYYEGRFWPHNTTLYVQDFKGNNPKYIYYLLKTLGFSHHNDKSGVPGVNRNDLHGLTVNAPPLRTQREIASILSAFDDKIELNRQMNHTLEAIAQTLFTEWFVRFNFPGFNGELVDGLPKGWRIGKIKEISVVNANTLSSKDRIDEILYVEISEVNRGAINSISVYQRGEEPSRARRKLKHGDVVLSTVRPNRGSYFLAFQPKHNLIASTGFAVFTATKVPFSFLYVQLTSDESLNYYGRVADGGAYPAISPSVILEMDVIIPDLNLLEDFHAVAGNIYQKIEQNLQENQTLTQLRDSLLPKLMSGQISTGADA